MSYYAFIGLALLCGAVFPIQAGLNGKVTKLVGNPILTSAVSVSVGLASILIYAIVTRTAFQPLVSIKEAPWYVWTAGVLGAFYVSAVIVIVPRLGFTLTFGLIVTGQILVSVLFDHFGVLDNPVKEITIGKAIGVGLLLVAVLMIRKF